MNKTKKLIITSLCVALGIVVPMAFHTVQNAGAIFLPMHIPVFVCAIICGWKYGAICGVVCPLISSLTTGMPPIAILPFMMVELGSYGLVSGLVMEKLNTKKLYADIYISLISAMLVGRAINGVVRELVLANKYSINAWLTASFVTCLPGILIQFIFIPSIIAILIKAKLIPNKYFSK